MAEPTVVERYITLGLDLGRHIDGMVDAYYGPPTLAERANGSSPKPPRQLADDARRLLADLAAGADADQVDATRRHWIAAQVEGLHTTARRLAGEPIRFSDEVESCYGVRPERVDEETFEAAHRRLDAVLPAAAGTTTLAERYSAWREAQAVPVDQLEAAVNSLADDLRERTTKLFGFPEGDRIDFELVTNQPWSGFNYYLGGLRSRVAINTDLPVLSPSLAHLVAHEAYPGHHTEHCHKEVGLVRRRHQDEETIFLVGTPQCLLAEGLADLGLEVVMGQRPEPTVSEHLRPLGIPYDAEVVAEVAQAGESLNYVRQNAALLLHEDGADVDDAVAYLQRWSLLSEQRAKKAIEFLTDPTWRAYMTCYIEGFPLCRTFVQEDPARFKRLITEQLIPADLVGP